MIKETQTTGTMKATDTQTLTPTKESPIFLAECSAFGFIEENIYKEAQIEVGDCIHCMPTFAISFTKAITKLHEWIIENKDFWLEYGHAATFTIYAIDGTIENDNVIEKKVYSITSSKANKYLL